MKPQIYADTGRLFFIILLVLSFAVYSSAQDFRSVQDGIEYAEMTRQIDNQPVKMNLLRLDLTKVRLDVVHAMDAAIGTETVSSIATRHGAIAAINAGFFRLDKSVFAGDAAGILKIDGNLWSEPVNKRIALGIINGKKKTEIVFGRLETTNLTAAAINTKTLDTNTLIYLSGINRERKDDEIILFTPQFGKTTLTNSNGTEIIVRKGKIIDIVNGKGNSEIPSGGFVVSVGEKQRQQIPKIKIGGKLNPLSAFNEVDENLQSRLGLWKKTEDIVGGVPQLIKNGRIEITWEQEKSSKAFVETRHPRTAVAKLKDGKFLMITVDGRQEESAGINLQNLAEILLELGAIDAMNLDGGGSTTMFLNGKVVNKPSDKEGERKVSDAILVFPRKKITKRFRFYPKNKIFR